MFGFYISNTEMKVTEMGLRAALELNNLMPKQRKRGANMTAGSGMGSGRAVYKSGVGVFRGTGADKINLESGIKNWEKSEKVNNHINTTTYELSGGRVVSFGGDAKQEAAHKVIDKIVKSKGFKWFCNLAQKNSAVAEAVGALFITCFMRPMAIMAMPQKDIDKNRKAASHSIASGVTGLVFAKIAYQPFSSAMAKIFNSIKDGNPTKYLGEKAQYLFKEGITRTKNGVTTKISNMDCFNQLATFGPKVLTAPILAALTVGTMPYIDRYVIDKYILRAQPKPDDKPVFTTYDHFKFITFKSTPSGKEVFQNFKGALK